MNDAPASVTDLKVTPAPEGAKQATISFNAPTKNNAGGALFGLTKIEVYAGGEALVHTFNSPVQGEALSYVDNVSENGVASYTVVAYNEVGRGVSLAASAFVGVDVPLPPSDVRLVETGEDEVTVTWSAPTRGANGGYVNPNELQYRVQRSDGAWMTLSQKGATGFVSDESNVKLGWRQESLYYHVHAGNDAGESGRGTSNSIMIGDPYLLPYAENFSSGFTNNQGWSNVGAGSFGQYYTDGLSSDGDGHCALFTPTGNTKDAEYVSSKIDIRGAVQPGVRLSYYAYPAADARLKVSVQVNGNEETILLGDINFNELEGNEGWRDTTLFMDGADEARYIRIHFRAETGDVNTPIAFDNVQVRDMVPYNVEAKLSTPRYVRASEDNNFYVRVNNIGTRDARNFKVQLFANNKNVAEVPSGTLAAGTDSTYVLVWKPTLEDAGVVQLHAVADYTLDADNDDNTTPNVPSL